jgi:hypothetical protein
VKLLTCSLREEAQKPFQQELGRICADGPARVRDVGIGELNKEGEATEGESISMGLPRKP